MKPSKTAMLYYWLGFWLLLFASILYFWNGAKDQILLPIGLTGLALMWLLGIQAELYKKEKKK